MLSNGANPGVEAGQAESRRAGPAFLPRPKGTKRTELARKMELPGLPLSPCERTVQVRFAGIYLVHRAQLAAMTLIAFISSFI